MITRKIPCTIPSIILLQEVWLTLSDNSPGMVASSNSELRKELRSHEFINTQGQESSIHLSFSVIENILHCQIHKGIYIVFHFSLALPWLIQMVFSSR
jgi:hypothetical protein